MPSTNSAVLQLSAPNSTIPTFAEHESQLYTLIFQQLDAENQGIVNAEALRSTLVDKSHLQSDTIDQVWKLVDPVQLGFVNKSSFDAILRIIGHVQAGAIPDPYLITVQGPLAKIEGFSRNEDVEAQNPSLPILKNGEISSLAAFFHEHTSCDILTEEEVYHISRKSGLPQEILEEVWELVDTKGLGEFPSDEFIVGMFLIQGFLNKSISSLPSKIPRSIWKQVASFKHLHPIERSTTTQTVDTIDNATSTTDRHAIAEMSAPHPQSEKFKLFQKEQAQVQLLKAREAQHIYQPIATTQPLRTQPPPIPVSLAPALPESSFAPSPEPKLMDVIPSPLAKSPVISSRHISPIPETNGAGSPSIASASLVVKSRSPSIPLNAPETSRQGIPIIGARSRIPSVPILSPTSTGNSSSYTIPVSRLSNINVVPEIPSLRTSEEQTPNNENSHRTSTVSSASNSSPAFSMSIPMDSRATSMISSTSGNISEPTTNILSTNNDSFQDSFCTLFKTGHNISALDPLTASTSRTGTSISSSANTNVTDYAAIVSASQVFKNSRSQSATSDISEFSIPPPRPRTESISTAVSDSSFSMSELSGLIGNFKSSSSTSALGGSATEFPPAYTVTDEAPRRIIVPSIPVTTPLDNNDWILPSDKKALYGDIFDGMDKKSKGTMNKSNIELFMKRLRVPFHVESEIYKLTGTQNSGRITKAEFIVIMFLIDKKLAGKTLPRKLPQTLIPPPQTIVTMPNSTSGVGHKKLKLFGRNKSEVSN